VKVAICQIVVFQAKVNEKYQLTPDKEARMKRNTLPTRVNMFVANFLNALHPQEKPSMKAPRGREATKRKASRRPERKDFFYYKPVIDQDTREIVGHLSDISGEGFKLDTQKPVPVERDFRFLVSLSSEVADKPSMSFVARSKWCRVDPLDPYVYNVGYLLIQISPEDQEIFNRMMEKYGREHVNRTLDLRRSNKW
jgi:hypothetical protein